MAEHALTTAARQWAHWPIAGRIAIIYAIARVVTTGLFALASLGSTPASRFGDAPALEKFVLGWDAQWYWLVAEEGYPSELPLTANGDVAENAWAFMPVYAFLARIVGFGNWGVGALLISLAAGYLACLDLYRLLHPRLGAAASFWSVTFFAFGPLAALFQVGYAEMLFLLLLLIALDLVSRHRYALVYPVLLVMGFTRPGILAFALFLGLHGIWRWRQRRTVPLPAADVINIVGLGALATVIGFSWQVIAAFVTGDPGAYLKTELSWRRNWLENPPSEFAPFDGFVAGAEFWFTQWGMPAWWGWIALVGLVAGLALLLWRSASVRKLGPDIRLWSASYLLYLLAVFFPQSSTFRLLLPLTPLAGALAVPRRRVYRWGVLLCCLIGQAAWIWAMYGQGREFWQVP